VSIQMDDVPLETAVRLLAETAGLKPVKVGNVLMVTTKATAAAMRSDPDLNEGNNNNQPQNQKMQMWQLMQMQQMQPNAMIFNGNLQLGGFAIANGLPIQQAGNQPVPPLDKPGDKDDEPPADGGKPAPPDKKPDPSK
jgi:hypothetical protein